MGSQPGMGVMIGMLGGNKETVEAVRESLGKVIRSVALADDKLLFEFEDGSRLRMWDDGQSCYERRYMRTDDDLAEYAGTTLLDFELAEAPNEPDDYGEQHEVQFLRVKTDRGTFTMATHNEHNGYYGGFWIVARRNDEA